eukprot:2429871-Prymnesium_polylepis.1
MFRRPTDPMMSWRRSCHGKRDVSQCPVLTATASCFAAERVQAVSVPTVSQTAVSVRVVRPFSAQCSVCRRSAE